MQFQHDKDMLLYFNDDFNRKKCVKLWGGNECNNSNKTV